jgi:hypothetical protein
MFSCTGFCGGIIVFYPQNAYKAPAKANAATCSIISCFPHFSYCNSGVRHFECPKSTLAL